MAKRGTRKRRSVEHEDFIANLYKGQRSPSSGAAPSDQGDVRVKDGNTLFECKSTGEPGGQAYRPRLVMLMEEIADLAWSEGKSPAVALRYWNPTSPLAGTKGWVDLTVRLTVDDSLDRNNSY